MAIVMSHSALNFHTTSPSPGTTSPVIVAFTVGVLICFVSGFCCIYICRCCFMNHLYAWIFNRPGDHLRRHINSPAAATASGAGAGHSVPPIRGLDPTLLQNFPVFTYLSVKESQGKNNINSKKYDLECAICLLEFEEDSLLRLLTVCRHVFHQECIDLWLESHKTCPVCRTDLDSSSKGMKFTSDHRNGIRMEENNPDDYNENETRIDVREDEEEEEEEVVSEKRFIRSHSTGHSIVMMKERGGRSSSNNNGDDCGDEKENEDKYTLKLPEHVEMKLVRGHIMASKSCSSYGEMTRICNKYYYAEAISGSSKSNTS